MKKYTIENNIIHIYDKEFFSPKESLECGQIFRFYVNGAGNYVVISGSNRAEFVETKEGYDVVSNDPQYFVDFLNLGYDNCEVWRNICGKSEFMKRVAEVGRGIKILKNEPFETICSFIVSANNNIKRIKGILNRISAQAGSKIEGSEDYAFPTIAQFKGLDEGFFKSIGAGYRSRYLSCLAENYEEFLKCNPQSLDTPSLKRRLLKILGVGEKVADCILLFAYNRYDVFPVDVWIERIYYQYFGKENISRSEIAKRLIGEFGENSGYAQQYLFYYKAIIGE